MGIKQMSSLWPVWCEIVCKDCAATTSGRFNTIRFNKGSMRMEAMRKGWRIIANDWACKQCFEKENLND